MHGNAMGSFEGTRRGREVAEITMANCLRKLVPGDLWERSLGLERCRYERAVSRKFRGSSPWLRKYRSRQVTLDMPTQKRQK